MSLKEFKTAAVQGQSQSNGKPFPTVFTPSDNNGAIYLQEYFANHHEEILNLVSEEGALYFRGFKIQSPNEMASVLNKLGLESFEYIGGAAVRKLIVGSDKRKVSSMEIFTTNEAPPEQPIPFHNELAQTPKYPDYISFYCKSAAEEGGSTSLVNCEELYKFIKSEHSEFLQQLEKLGVRYSRIVNKEDNPESPIGRGWKNIFNCETREEVENKKNEYGFELEWLEGDYCRLTSIMLPAVIDSKVGRKVFCNQIIAVFKGWIDEKNQPENCLKFGDSSSMPSDVLTSISNYADKIKTQIEWEAGDFILIDNQVAMHSREPFKGHTRKIYASLLKKPVEGKKTINIKSDLSLVLNSGDEMPVVGFGTWKLPNEVAEDLVYNAIKHGSKLIDCAATYGNEVEVGRGIKKALDEGIISRDKLFVTSKLWNTDHRPEHVKLAFKRTLTDLGLDYLDLYLIHYPISLKYVDPQVAYPAGFEYEPFGEEGPQVIVDNVPLLDTWRAMEELVDEGLIRNIGVSNFTVAILRDLINGSRIKPVVNQVELHPFLTQKNLIKFCQQSGVQITSYSTMGGASYVEMGLSSKEELIIETPIIKKLSEKYNRTSPQIIFKWAIQQGLAIIPKTSKVERLKENLDVTGWVLSREDCEEIDKLNRKKRYCDVVNFLGEEGAVGVLIWE